jgi:CheY-like chemotaxis protein
VDNSAASSSQLTIPTDLSMPVMDGLTSSRHIRKHELENSLPRTRIVALTCFSSNEYQRDAALSGVDMFLIKPVPMKTLKPILDLDPGFFPEG